MYSPSSPKRRFPALSRRRLLQGLGLGAACAPLFPILNVSGQEALAPKRLLLVFTPDGIAAQDWNTTIDWQPQGSETDFTFRPVHAPLEPYKSKIVVPWGLTMSAGGAGEAHAYGMAGIWTGAELHEPHEGADFDGGNGHRTGWGSGPSIDQIVASSYGSEGMPYAVAPDAASQETAYRTVELGVQSGQPHSVSRMIYKGDKQPIHPETSPRAAFDRLFANVTPSGSEAPMEDPAAVQATAEQSAIVDSLKDDLGRLRTRLGSAEYHKLDAHLEGLLALERRLNVTPTAAPALGCTIPPAPAATGGGGGGSRGDFPTEITQMIDITAHMLACDVTRVASLQISQGFSNVTHTWLGHNSAHHTMSHDGNDRRVELEAIDTWYSGHFAYLLEKLDSVSEGNGTLLDNTLIVWGRELGNTAHRMERVPLIMAGSGRGALTTGRNLSYDRERHAKLLVSIAQIMGIDTSSVGNLDANSGPLSGMI